MLLWKESAGKVPLGTDAPVFATFRLTRLGAAKEAGLSATDFYLVRANALPNLQDRARTLDPDILNDVCGAGCTSAEQLQRAMVAKLDPWFRAGCPTEPRLGLPTLSAAHIPPALPQLYASISNLHHLHRARIVEGSDEPVDQSRHVELMGELRGVDVRAAADALEEQLHAQPQRGLGAP